MDFNPLTGTCAEIQKQVDGLQQSEKQVADELQWYSSIDPRALTDDLRRNEAMAEQLQMEIQALEKEIQENAARSGEIELAMGTLTRTFSEIKRQIDGLQGSEKQVADELLWYSSIDPRALTKNLRENKATAEKLQSEILALDNEIPANAARLGEIEPAIGTLLNPFNWFARDQLDLRRRRTQLREIGNQKAAQRQAKVKQRKDTRARMAKPKSDLQRHRAFNLAKRQSDLSQITQTIAGKKDELAIVADRIRRDHEMLAQICEIGNHKAAQRQAKFKQLEDIRARIAKPASDLQRHRAFDLAQRQSDLSQIKQSIGGKKDELAIVTDRKRRVDEVLAPLLQEMQNLESSKRRAESDLETAQDLDGQLSSAENSYERAMVHEECESRFGVRSPRKIIGERQREIRRLERDYDKAKRRVEEIAWKAARKIDTIVIDGNNLCYEGGTFIGLAAIEALLPLLCRMCAVVVVFDSAIRRLLNTDDSGLKKRLGNNAKAHIVASKRMADETVLDLACASELTYVLSNDRFGDFNEKSAVKDARIIRHEIVNGNVFVHDLQLRAAYG